MTARIREFLKQRKDEGPCLVVDLDIVRDNYQSFARALPDSKVFYAVKANPAPEILMLLADLGACFDVASVSETAAVLAERIFEEAPQVHILATSRESLRVEGEHVHRLLPLGSPPEDAGLTAAQALGTARDWDVLLGETLPSLLRESLDELLEAAQ